MSRPTLAVDPGAAGAAVLLDADASLMGAWAWTPYPKRTPRLWRIHGPNGILLNAETLHGVGSSIASRAGALTKATPLEDSGWYYLTVEALFAGRNWAAAMKLGESAALVYGPLTMWAVNMRHPYRPSAMQWRPLVLGVKGNTSSPVCEATARQLCASRWPGLGGLLDNGHACEAACIAYAGHLHQRAKNA